MTVYAESPDLRLYLGIQPGTEESSELLQDALTVASAAVDAYCGRTFGSVSASGTRIFPGGTDLVLIDDAATVTLVEESDDRVNWTAASSTLYWVDPPNSTPKTSLGAASDFAEWVRVTGTWGYGATVPPEVKRATIMLAARYHRRRESVTGTEGWGEFGVIRVTRHDSDITQLLAPLRRVDATIGLA